MTEQMRKIPEGKRPARRRLGYLPFLEKIKILEKLRDSDRAIAQSSLGKKRSG